MTVPDEKDPDDGPQPPPSVDEEKRSIEAWEEWARGNKEAGEHKERRDG